MNLDEAIEHCREKANTECECGKEHLQLYNWLIELKTYREKELNKEIGMVEADFNKV